MNAMAKYSATCVIAIIVAFFYLKPIVSHSDEYKVVIINNSERLVNSVTISGAGASSRKIGPIRVGDMQDYFFKPNQKGELTYTIAQGSKKITGVINDHMQPGDTGDQYVVINELYKVRVYDEYDGAY